MQDWKIFSLGDVCKTISETYKKNSENVVLINTSDVLQGKILNHSFVANKNLKGQFKKTFKKDDILFSEIRPINRRYAFVDFENTKNYIASTKLMVLRVNQEKILSKYFYYWITSEKILSELQHLAETRSGTFPQITFDSELANLQIKVPPLEIQKKIVAVLSALDDKIELNNAINKNLEQQAQAIFDEFYKSADEKIFSLSSLDKIANYLNGLAMQKFRPAENEVGLPVLKIRELRQGVCDDTSDRCTEKIKSDFVVDDGDIIFSWSGTLLVDFWCGGKCGLNQHLFKVTSEKFGKWFYYLWTKKYLKSFQKSAADMATTMGHIKKENLSKSKVLIPDDENYLKLENFLEPIFDKIINNRIENKKLAEMRDLLLPRLLNGEIDVSKVEG